MKNKNVIFNVINCNYLFKIMCGGDYTDVFLANLMKL